MRWLLLIVLWAGVMVAQDVPGVTTLKTGTRLVLVPASVRTKKGEPVFTLQAKDFLVTDDGIEQKVRLEEDTDQQPLALVVVVEAGELPQEKYADYSGLSVMMESLAGGVAEHKVAVIGFDSEAAVVQDWTSNVDAAAHSLSRIETGDGGAASLDALEMAVKMLQAQPLGYRRAILLIGETVDRNSKTTLARALRAVSDTNTVIYALGYSSTRATTRQQLGELNSAEAGPPHGCMGKEADVDLEGNPLAPPANPHAEGSSAGGGVRGTAIKAYDCLSQLAPPLRLAKIAVYAALNGFRTNVPETAARLSGGEYFKSENAKSMVRDLDRIANRLPNRYFLSFTPTTSHPGLHAISVKLREPREGVVVVARNSYWED